MNRRDGSVECQNWVITTIWVCQVGLWAICIYEAAHEALLSDKVGRRLRCIKLSSAVFAVANNL